MKQLTGSNINNLENSNVVGSTSSEIELTKSGISDNHKTMSQSIKRYTIKEPNYYDNEMNDSLDHRQNKPSKSFSQIRSTYE